MLRMLQRIRRYTYQKSKGFTLIEVLVIAPVVLMSITVFIAMMVLLTGDVLVARERNAAIYDTQDALNDIEREVKNSVQFLSTSGTLLSPQGKDNVSSAFTSASGDLIIKSIVTDKSLTSADRKPVYYAYQPNQCGASEGVNSMFTARTIYFLKSDKSLWKRTYLPAYNRDSAPNAETVCSDPWQLNSCSPGQPMDGRCKTRDVELIKNVTDFSVDYFTSADSTVDSGDAAADTAVAVRVSITTSKKVSGKDLTYTSSLRALKVGGGLMSSSGFVAPVPAPETPIINSTVNGSTSVAFSWSAVNAVNYDVAYNIDGGSWVPVFTDSTATAYTVNGSAGQTITLRVTAKNTGGFTTSSASQTLSSFTQVWNDANLVNNWVNYDTTKYGTAAYTITSSGEVFLRGRIKGGTRSWSTTMFTLPEGYRPDYRITFNVISDNSNLLNRYARVEINTAGDVKFMIGAGIYTALDGIRFMANGRCAWTTLTPRSPWVSWTQDSYAPTSVCINTSQQKVFLRGYFENGETTLGNIMMGLPDATYQSPYNMKFPASDEPKSGGAYMARANYGINAGSAGMTYQGNMSNYIVAHTDYYPSSYTNWTDVVFNSANNWSNYGPPYANLQYTKSSDGVVTLRGAIKGGTTAEGTVVGTLPVGYRPSTLHQGSIESDTSAGRIDVDTSGNIIVKYNISSTFMSVDNITYVAAP